MTSKNRLSHADFDLVLSLKTRRFQGAFFSVTVAPAPLLKAVKIACVVSKKVSKRAVDRNRIKRRARAVFATVLGGIPRPAYVIFYAKKESLNASFGDIQTDIQALMSRVSSELSVTA